MAENGSTAQVTSEDVLQVAESILSEMLGLTVQSAPEGFASNQRSGLTGCVPITGDWDGAVTVACSEGFARGVAAANSIFPFGTGPVRNSGSSLSPLKCARSLSIKRNPPAILLVEQNSSGFLNDSTRAP